MFCPCLEIFIQTGLIQSLFRATATLQLSRGNRRRHAAKIGQSIIIDPDPVPDIAFGHSFSVKIITVGEGSDKDRNLCGLIRVPAVMQIELLPRIVQLEIDTGITLDVEGQLFGISPFAVTPASTGDSSLASFHLRHLRHCISATDASGSLLCGPELVNSFLVKIPIEKLVR